MKFELFDLEKLYVDGYRWIAIDKDGSICAFKKEPIKFSKMWDMEIFKHHGDVAFLSAFGCEDNHFIKYNVRPSCWMEEIYELVKV